MLRPRKMPAIGFLKCVKKAISFRSEMQRMSKLLSITEDKAAMRDIRSIHPANNSEKSS